jgi:hypothetical protein
MYDVPFGGGQGARHRGAQCGHQPRAEPHPSKGCLMTLLDHYVNAVRMYLPKGPQQEDILSELREHLQSKLDDEEERLGRPVTEVEQEALLTRHGNPMVVAERYGAPKRTVAFGWQLIGPELFPLYARILLLNWSITIAAEPIVHWYGTSMPRLGFWTFAGPMLVQLVIVTLVFSCVDAFQRLARRRAAAPERQLNWRFPPAYLQPIPKWQSLVGLMMFVAVTIWWTLVPFWPAVIFGSASWSLEFSSSLTILYWAVLGLLTVSTAQRAATFARPDWNWLQAVTRLITNSAALLLLYPFAMSFPYVIAAASAPDAARAEMLAHRINLTMWWSTMGTMSVYWLFNAMFHAWLCAQFLRYAGRRRTEQFS